MASVDFIQFSERKIEFFIGGYKIEIHDDGYGTNKGAVDNVLKKLSSTTRS